MFIDNLLGRFVKMSVPIVYYVGAGTFGQITSVRKSNYLLAALSLALNTGLKKLG
jgi:hypothetical protein